jgi:hypothetical protein
MHSPLFLVGFEYFNHQKAAMLTLLPRKIIFFFVRIPSLVTRAETPFDVPPSAFSEGYPEVFRVPFPLAKQMELDYVDPNHPGIVYPNEDIRLSINHYFFNYWYNDPSQPYKGKKD